MGCPGTTDAEKADCTEKSTAYDKAVAKKAKKDACDASATSQDCIDKTAAFAAFSLAQTTPADPVATALTAKNDACPGTTDAEKADCATKTTAYNKAVAKKAKKDACDASATSQDCIDKTAAF